MRAPCDPGLDDLLQRSQKKNTCSLYTAFTSQETFSQLKIIHGMSIDKVFFLDRVFEEGIYYVCRGDVFVIL